MATFFYTTSKVTVNQRSAESNPGIIVKVRPHDTNQSPGLLLRKLPTSRAAVDSRNDPQWCFRVTLPTGTPEQAKVTARSPEANKLEYASSLRLSNVVAFYSSPERYYRSTFLRNLPKVAVALREIYI